MKIFHHNDIEFQYHKGAIKTRTNVGTRGIAHISIT